jgi:uncharacterized repeat protein (TIGR01451 family)
VQRARLVIGFLMHRRNGVLKRLQSKSAWLTLAGVVALMQGCSSHMPHSFTWPSTRPTMQTHPKPPEGGYYKNWDPHAVTLEVTPLHDVNPVRTQHILIATVRDKNGKPLPNRRVEWIINDGGVGDIVEVDESGVRMSRGYKVTNHFAVSHTNNRDHKLTRGNSDPSDDIVLKRGQTWCVITSPVEGTTNLTVYAPGVYDWEKHKVFATKLWMDVKWNITGPATNLVGTTHDIVTNVTKASDGTPLAGYEVTYRIVDGPAGSFDGGGNTKTVVTDAQGNAKVTLRQTSPQTGLNNITADIVRPENIQCCKPPQHIATLRTSKKWEKPGIAVDKKCPAEVSACDPIEYIVTIRNTGDTTLKNVKFTDNLPSGCTTTDGKTTVSGGVPDLGAGQAKEARFAVKCSKPGRYDNKVQASADGGLNAEASCSTVVKQPALTIAKSCPGTRFIGRDGTYEITVTNTGDMESKNTVVTDALPAGTTFVSASDGGSASGGSIVWNLGNLGAGQSRKMTAVVKFNTAGDIKNTVTAKGVCAEATASCATKVEGIPAILLEVIDLDDPVEVGAQTTYEIKVTNQGSKADTNITLDITLPAEEDFISGTGPTPSTAAGKSIKFAPLPNLAPDAVATYRLVVKGNKAGDVRLKVSMKSDNIGSPVEETEATRFYE